jgi:regulatory protein
MTPSDLENLRSWCALRERCTDDVLQRLRRQQVGEAEAEQAVERLRTEGFLDDRRYVEAYVEGHAVGRRWGPARIRAGLRAKRIPDALIAPALARLDPAEARDTLHALARRRADELPAGRERVIRWLLRRGFPLDDVLAAVDAAAHR